MPNTPSHKTYMRRRWEVLKAEGRQGRLVKVRWVPAAASCCGVCVWQSVLCVVCAVPKLWPSQR